MVIKRGHMMLDKPAESALGLDRKCAASPHGDCFRAVRKIGKQIVLVWVSRQSLDATQERSFLKYVQRFRAASTTMVSDYGLDSDRRGFVSLAVDQSTALDSDHPTAKQLRRRFIECVAKVESFHDVGLVCGNICHGSFVLRLDGEPHFVGLLGGFAYGDLATLPLEVRAYIPPARDKQTAHSAASDVYSLAVVGLQLFGAQFPPSGINPEEMSLYLERVMPEAPRWVSRVLADIVRHPDKRAYRNAGDLLAALSASEKTASALPESGARSDGKSPRNQPLDDLSVDDIARRIRRSSAERFNGSLQRFMHSTGYQAVVVGVIVSGALIMGVVPVGGMWTKVTSLAIESAPGSQEGLSAQGGQSHQSFGDLVKSVEQATGSDESSATWKAMFERVTQQGGSHTSHIIQRIVSTDPLNRKNEAVSLAMILNPETSLDDRVKHVIMYEQVSPDSAARIAAALALEKPELSDRLNETMVRGIQRQFPPQVSRGAEARSTDAIILALDLNNDIIPETTFNLTKRLSAEDLWWAIEAHAVKRSSKISMVTMAALKTGFVMWPRRAFLELVRQAEASSLTPFEALISSARNGARVDDVARFSSWISPLSVKALYSVLVSSTEREVIAAAFAAITSKPDSQPLVVSVVSLIQAEQGEAALPNYAKLIGTLGLSDGISRATLDQGIQSMSGASLALPILRLLLQGGDPAVVLSTLGIYGAQIHPNFLLPLLEHREPSVRIAVIPFLKDLPLASSRAAVTKLFAAEKDPDVRAAYERELELPK